jgi:hypothetical protein
MDLGRTSIMHLMEKYRQNFGREYHLVVRYFTDTSDERTASILREKCKPSMKPDASRRQAELCLNDFPFVGKYHSQINYKIMYKTYINILLHVEPLLGYDREISSYTTGRC